MQAYCPRTSYPYSPDEDYLLALDSTKWLQRVGELLSAANAVVTALTVHRAHVLVAFECGWDRTTQVRVHV